MKMFATLGAVLTLLTLPTLAVAAQRDPVDRFDAMRLRAEIRREVSEAVRRAHRDLWSARRDVWRARSEARREIAQAVARRAPRSASARGGLPASFYDWRGWRSGRARAVGRGPGVGAAETGRFGEGGRACGRCPRGRSGN